MKRAVCVKCNRKQGEVNFSWTATGKKRSVCDICFETGSPAAGGWMPATEFTVIKLPPETAEGSQVMDMQIAKPDGWRGRKF